MAETLIDELIVTTTASGRDSNKQRIRKIRAALRIYADNLTKLQNFYTGLGLFSDS